MKDCSIRTGIRRKMARFLVIVLLAGVAGGLVPVLASMEVKAEALSGDGYGEPVIYGWEDLRAAFGQRSFAPVIGAGVMTVDGDLSDWQGFAELRLPASAAQIEISDWGGDADVSASVYLAYDDDYFYWAAKVTDDVHEPVGGSSMWRGDSIQFAFGLEGVYGPEYGVNLMDGVAGLVRFSAGGAVSGAEQIAAAAVRDGNVTVYEVRMPWTTIGAGKPESGQLPFTLLVNDNDGEGRRGWIEWTPGIGKKKAPEAHGVLQLIPADTPWSFWVEGPEEVVAGQAAVYTLYAVSWDSTPVALELASQALAAELELCLPGNSVAEVKLVFIAPEAGTHRLDFALSQPDGGLRQEQTWTAEAVMSVADIEALLEALENDLPALEQLLTQAEGLGRATDYQRVNYAVIRDFIDYGRQDLANGRQARAQYVALELDALYEEAQTQLLAVVEDGAVSLSAPRYVTGPYTLSGSSFIGNTEVRNSGLQEERPIFYTGYGHFNQVRADIPKFQDLGTNIIQVEIGPRDVILDKTDFVYRYAVGRSGEVSATTAIVQNVSHTGDYSVKIANASSMRPQVYINVRQTLAVEPSTTYRFSAWVKGENARNVWFPGGPGWSQRTPFPNGTYDWVEVTTEYTTGPNETSFNLVLLSENTGTVYIDDLSVTKAGSGINLVQNPGFEETGGYDEEKEYVISTQRIQSDIQQVLAQAAEHDVAVNLLLSPHYFPSWARSRWPELNASNTGFIQFSILHPMAQAIVEDYLRTLIPLIKDYDSLHSVTLSNEPVHDNKTDPYVLAAWRDYLAEEYGNDIGALNAAYQSAYGSFAEVAMPSALEVNRRSYDYVVFNADYFARWHEWMAGIIHELAPDLPVHAKIMGDPQKSLGWGVDVERFSELSQINGNDNWNYIGAGAAGFLKELSFYDMQASFNTAPVFNSEHHVIADGDSLYVPEQARHVRASLWQSAIHGRSASTFWVWERTYDPEASREGSILHRPDVVAAIGRTNLDLNRLAREVTAFQQEVPQAAILYSTASGVYASDYFQVMLQAYEALSLSGYKAGFVSEKQAAAGKLAEYGVLIVPHATHVEAATLADIRAFMEQGGKVLLAGGDSLGLRPDGMAHAPGDLAYVQAHAAVVAANRTAEQLRGDLQPLLADLDLAPLHLTLTDTCSGTLPHHVEWRSVVYEGRTLLSAINYSTEPVTVTVSRENAAANGFADLIEVEQHAGSQLVLAPYTPYLLEITGWTE